MEILCKTYWNFRLNFDEIPVKVEDNLLNFKE